MDKEVKSISKEESIVDLATVWQLYGKDKKALSQLTGYSTVAKSYPASGNRRHSYTVSGNQVICNEAVNEWKSKLDTDGKIVQAKYTEYTKAADLINYALREMEKIVEPLLTIEVEFLY